MEHPNKLTLIYPYFENPKMLELHFKEWAHDYSILENAKDRVEVILVDDCSPKFPALPIVNKWKSQLSFPVRLYRITKKVMWNWIAARNVGAHEADDSWLFISDMDLMLRSQDFHQVLRLIDGGVLKEMACYLFDRVIAPDDRPYKSHPNTYLQSKKLYWTVGGYDEKFSGLYGCDGTYRRMILKEATDGQFHLHGIRVTYYPRSFIPDSGVQDDGRKETRDALKNKQYVKDSVRAMQSGDKPLSLSFPYERQV